MGLWIPGLVIFTYPQSIRVLKAAETTETERIDLHNRLGGSHPRRHSRAREEGMAVVIVRRGKRHAR